MKFKNSIVSISYPNIDQLKKKYYKNDDLLDTKLFKEAIIPPVPDEAPVEIPRIVTSSIDENCNFSISPITTTFQINYTEDKNSSFEQCIEFMNQYVTNMFSLLDKLTDEKYNYLGIVTNMIKEDLEEDSTNYISLKLLKENKNNHLYDINIRYTFVESGKFINVMLYNARKFKFPLETDKAGMLGEDKQISNSDIGIVLDVNDRYSFNQQSDYVSNSKKFSELTNLSSSYINNKLTNIINGL